MDGPEAASALTSSPVDASMEKAMEPVSEGLSAELSDEPLHEERNKTTPNTRAWKTR